MGISVAIFAHNEEDNIERCMNSVLLSTRHPENLSIHVLINGSRDRTLEIVQNLAKTYPQIHPVDIKVGCKSNAWNTFVYSITDFNQKFYFLDGDNWLPSYALDYIDEQFDTSQYSAVAPTPLGVAESLREMMIQYKFISGNFYGVSGEFLKMVVGHQFKLPIGFIGDDSLVTYILQEGIEGKHEVKDIKVIDTVGPVIPRIKILPSTVIFMHKRYKRYALRHFQQEAFYYLARNKRLQELPQYASGIKNILFKMGWSPFLRFCGIQTLYHPYAIIKILRSKAPANAE